MADKDIKDGDKESLKWGTGHRIAEVCEDKGQGKLENMSDKGNVVKKKVSPDNPAVHISHMGNDVMKSAHEVSVEEAGPNHNNINKDKMGTAVALENKRGKKEGCAAPETKKGAKNGKKKDSAVPKKGNRGIREESAVPETDSAQPKEKVRANEDNAAPVAEGGKKDPRKRAASETNAAEGEEAEKEKEKDAAASSRPQKKARGAAAGAAKKAESRKTRTTQKKDDKERYMKDAMDAGKKDEHKEMKNLGGRRQNANATTMKKARGTKKSEESQAIKEMQTELPKKATTETGGPKRSGRTKA